MIKTIGFESDRITSVTDKIDKFMGTGEYDRQYP